MITLFYAYSRSGGTLLNRVLTAMPDNVVLSEVLPTNPRGGTIPGIESGGVWHQALYWYDIRLKNKEYIPAILELEDVCQRSGRHLIIREWCVGCYPPHTKIFSEHNISPPYGLFALKHLPRKQTRPFAFVRHGADTCKSSFPNNHHWNNKTAQYAKTYLAYAQDVHESRMPIYDYAELCAQPHAFVEKLCSEQGIPFDKTALSRFAHIITACGDMFYQGRYANSTTIHPLKRRVLPDITQENLYRNDPSFRTADSLLGLEPDSPLDKGTHAATRKQFKKHRSTSLSAFVTCKPITSPIMWRYDDIIGSQRIQAPPLSARLNRHLATIPPDCVVVVLYARYLDRSVFDTLKALDDAPADFPPRAFIIMTRKKRAFLTIPSPLRARTHVHTLKKDTGEMPDSNIETLSLMRELAAHNKHHALFLCSKHMIITARNILPRLLALCPFHDTATALSYGHTDTGGGIDTHPLIIHSKKNTTSHLGYLHARGAKGTPFADRRILFDPKATNNKPHSPLRPQLQMDFVKHYYDLIRLPFINWTKVYDSKGALLLLFADHNSVRLATTRTQKIYGMLTKIYRQNAPLSKKEKRFMQRCHRYMQAGPYAKYMYAFYYDERWLRLKRSIKKRLPHVKTLLRIKK